MRPHRCDQRDFPAQIGGLKRPPMVAQDPEHQRIANLGGPLKRPLATDQRRDPPLRAGFENLAHGDRIAAFNCIGEGDRVHAATLAAGRQEGNCNGNGNDHEPSV